MEAIYFSFLWELRMRTLPRTDEKGAFRIGDLIVLDISVAVAADFLQNDVSKETKSYPLSMVQNEISTFLRAVQRPG